MSPYEERDRFLFSVPSKLLVGVLFMWPRHPCTGFLLGNSHREAVYVAPQSRDGCQMNVPTVTTESRNESIPYYMRRRSNKTIFPFRAPLVFLPGITNEHDFPGPVARKGRCEEEPRGRYRLADNEHRYVLENSPFRRISGRPFHVYSVRSPERPYERSRQPPRSPIVDGFCSSHEPPYFPGGVFPPRRCE